MSNVKWTDIAQYFEFMGVTFVGSQNGRVYDLTLYTGEGNSAKLSGEVPTKKFGFDPKNDLDNADFSAEDVARACNELGLDPPPAVSKILRSEDGGFDSHTGDGFGDGNGLGSEGDGLGSGAGTGDDGFGDGDGEVGFAR